MNQSVGKETQTYFLNIFTRNLAMKNWAQILASTIPFYLVR